MCHSEFGKRKGASKFETPVNLTHVVHTYSNGTRVRKLFVCQPLLIYINYILQSPAL